MRARATLVEYSSDKERYRVGGWYLDDRTRCEVMLAGRWVPGEVSRDAITPGRWRIFVPMDRDDHGYSVAIVLMSGLRVRPARERAAETALER